MYIVYKYQQLEIYTPKNIIIESKISPRQSKCHRSPNPNSTNSQYQQKVGNMFNNNSIIEQIDEYLQKYGADITNKLQTQLRQPPLYFAINLPDDQSSLSVMRRLVQFGANVMFKDQNQQTVIFYACRDGKIGCVEFLQGLGVSMYDEDAYGQTPLYYIANQNQLQLLSKYTKPQQFNHVDKLAQQTPLYYAAKKGHLQMCKQLVANGCDINHHDSHNKTAVQYARRAREHDVAQYLSNQIKRQKDAKLQIVKEKEQSKAMQEENHSHSKDVKKMVKKQVESESVCNVQRSFYKIVVVNDQGQTRQLTEEDIRALIRQRPNLQQVLANPGSIPRQTLESQKPAEQREKWQKIATKILTLCWKNKSSVWFQQPVDPVKFGITDYNDIVSHPMDLGTIKKKLAYNFYSSPQKFAADIKLVWDNCYKYNGSEHEISICAKEVQAMFNQLYEKQLKMFESNS